MRSKKKLINDMIENKISEEIKDTWNQNGGLIPTSLAAMILNVSMPRINQIWKERGFKKYPFEGKREFLSYTDVMVIENERKKPFKAYTYTDQENGIIAEIKTFEGKNTTINVNTRKAQIIDLLEDIIYALKK